MGVGVGVGGAVGLGVGVGTGVNIGRSVRGGVGSDSLVASILAVGVASMDASTAVVAADAAGAVADMSGV